MATSGRVSNTIPYVNVVFITEWTQYKDIPNNTSTLVITNKIKLPAGTTYTLGRSGTAGAKVDGTIYTYNMSLISGRTTEETTIKLGTITTNPIKHLSNGSKTVDVWATHGSDWQFNNDGAYYGTGNIFTIALEPISPAAKITSAPNFTDESNPVVKYSNPLGNQVSELGIYIADVDTDAIIIPYRDISAVSTSYTFNFTDAEREILRNYLKNTTSKKVNFCLDTVYNGKTYYNEVSRTLSIKGANPVITCSIGDINTSTVLLTGNPNKLVKYHSIAQAEMSAVGQKGAVIDLDTLIIKNGGSSAFSSPAVFENIESNEFTFSIGDSRGATSSITVKPEMVEYIKPTCNIERSELEATGGMLIDVEGNYFNNTFGNYENTLLVQCRYKIQDGEYSNWLEMDATPRDNNTYRASITIPDLNYREKYIIQCRVIDRLGDAETAEIAVKSFPVFHWSENDFVFEVPVIFNAGVEGTDIGTGEGEGGGSSSGLIDGNATITGDCVINGNLRLKGAGNYGNTIYFGDGSYAMISEPTDDALTIKATKLNLEGLVSLNGGVVDSGSWIPKLNNSSAVSSYSVQQGWYSRVGKVITIGWQLKATINSGYSSTALSITGAPFTPAYAAFGGGVAHNINVSAGFNFEGWTIDTSGNISARTQPCNNTAAGNLQISSSTYYPSGSGNVITLAGTICYTTN